LCYGKDHLLWALICYFVVGLIEIVLFIFYTELGKIEIGILVLVIWISLISLLFGSLLPDIDHPNSILGRKRWFKFWRCVFQWEHREETHNPLWGFLYGAPFIIPALLGYYYLDNILILYSGLILFVSAVFGYFNHCIIDPIDSWRNGIIRRLEHGARIPVERGKKSKRSRN
jgi:membrane-bound metal-dependent hydrolase YbcI (DUF457 family)